MYHGECVVLSVDHYVKCFAYGEWIMKCAAFEVQLKCGFHRFTVQFSGLFSIWPFGKCSTQMPYDHLAHPTE